MRGTSAKQKDKTRIIVAGIISKKKKKYQKITSSEADRSISFPFFFFIAEANFMQET